MSLTLDKKNSFNSTTQDRYDEGTKTKVDTMLKTLLIPAEKVNNCLLTTWQYLCFLEYKLQFSYEKRSCSIYIIMTHFYLMNFPWVLNFRHRTVCKHCPWRHSCIIKKGYVWCLKCSVWIWYFVSATFYLLSFISLFFVK